VEKDEARRMSAREVVLGRIRAALDDVASDEPAHPKPAAAPSRVASSEESLRLFERRAADYDATVTRVAGAPVAIAQAISAQCASSFVRRLLVPDGFPKAWLPAGVEQVLDRAEAPLDYSAIEDTEGVVTTCAAAIAETGTIILDGGAGQGRRALTLLPDLHICVVPARRVLAGVADAFAHLKSKPAALAPPLTLISGPSATSDIELQRVEGMHGPRRLAIIVADCESTTP
jgi:L-lactate dehydrogenase complex protein LldG